MGASSNIEWTDATWNPMTGCTKVSAGCDHCYAETLAERFRGTPGHYYEGGFDLQLRPDKLDAPLRWQRPRRVFVNSMSDLFHQGVPDEYVVQVFAVMALAPRHTFQVLTKRHGRMRSLVGSRDFPDLVAAAVLELARQAGSAGGVALARSEREAVLARSSEWRSPIPAWPLPNVWLGVSVENQGAADLRVGPLLQTPAAVRFLSCEPLLGPVELPWTAEALDWVIAGGESGPGSRPMHPGWVRSLRDFSVNAGVAFHFKQWGDWAEVMGKPRKGDVLLDVDGTVHEQGGGHTDAVAMRRVGKRHTGRSVEGRTWDESPAVGV